MTRHEQQKLMTALREIIATLQRSGTVTTSAIADALIRDYPELCDKHKDRLFREAVAGLSRRVMKNSIDSAKSAQFVLPLKLRSLRDQLPGNISLPPPLEIEAGRPMMDDEFVWRSIEEASYAELGLYLDHLRGSIQADQRRYKATNRLRQFLRPYMDNEEHRDEAIGPMLAEIAAAEQEKAH